MASDPTGDPPPRPRRLLRAGILLAVLAAGAGLAGYAFLRDGPSPPPAPLDLVEDFPPDTLAGYLPEDAGAVFTLRPRRLLDAPVVRGHYRPQVEQLLARDRAVARWLALASIDPQKDVDEARAVVSRGDPSRPLLLLRGRFDVSRFQTGPDQLRLAPRDGFRVYESRGPGSAVNYVAPAGGYLVAGASADRVVAALRHALHPGPVSLRDERLRQLLADVDRDRALSMAVSFDVLGRVPKMANLGLEAVLRPVIASASGVEGGLAAGDDLTATFRFTARDEEGAAKLEEVLRSACEVAQGASLLPGVDADLLPVFDLLGTGEFTRDGTAVGLRCRLTPGG
jgi:hypothetical protein